MKPYVPESSVVLCSCVFRWVVVLLLLLFTFPFASLHAQEESRFWTLIGSPPPRITGIAAIAETVLISTENGAFMLSSTAASWTALPTVPPGRLIQGSLVDTSLPTTTEIVSVGLSAWVLSSTASAWRISTNPAYTTLTNKLPYTPLTLTQATVRMPGGYDVIATSGAISIRKGGIERYVFSPLDGTQEIIGLVRAGSRVFCATERNIFCGEEITVDKANPFELLGSTRLIWKTCTGGLSSMVDNVQIVSNRILAQNRYIQNGYISLNGGEAWRRRTQDTFLLLSNVPTRDSALLALTATSILRSRDGGESWNSAGFTLPKGFRWFRDLRTRLVQPCLVGAGGGALRYFAQDNATLRTLGATHVVESLDGGLTWQMAVVRGLPDNVALSAFVQSPRGYVFAKDNAFERPVLFRSADGGKTWQMLDLGRVPEVLAVHPTTGTLLLSGSPPMRSEDDGRTWRAVQGLPFQTNGRFDGASEFACAPGSAVLLNVRDLTGFRSNDDGRNFVAQSLPVPNVYTLRAVSGGLFLALAADSVEGQRRSRVWASQNSGVSWERLEMGLPEDSSFVAADIALGLDSSVYILSSHGIFRLNRSKAGNQAVLQSALMMRSAEAEEGTSLHLFPNPAHASATLRVSLGSASNLTWDILDRRGGLIQCAFDGNLTAGVHLLTADIRTLPSGQYFCRVQAPSSVNSSRTATFPLVITR